MLLVLLAAIPGIATQLWFFGWGTLVQIILAVISALSAEALVLKLRNQPIAAILKDNSALLTGLLLAVSIPPLAPWWMVVLGTVFAVIIAKQLYGGLGQNPFNLSNDRLCCFADLFPGPDDQLAPPMKLQQPYRAWQTRYR